MDHPAWTWTCSDIIAQDLAWVCTLQVFESVKATSRAGGRFIFSACGILDGSLRSDVSKSKPQDSGTVAVEQVEKERK